MNWNDELAVIRRYLRDPSGNIWSEATLRHLYNEVQQDLQTRTSVLEDVIAQRVPDLYHFSYMHNWEYEYIPTTVTEYYQCLRKHDDKVFCHSWEPQIVAGIDAATSDPGAHFTHPFEAFMGQTVGEEVKMKLPRNCRDIKWIAYDEEPISATSRKAVQSYDSEYMKTTGTPQCYYMTEAVEKTYVLYPKPSTAFVDEPDGEGIAFFVEDDTEDTTVGIIAIRSGTSESSNVGASADVVGVQNNVLLIFDVTPTDVVAYDDESDFPEFLRKYIRFGVLSRAYTANTDGRIPSLAKLWGQRYELGVEFIKKFMRNKRNDRNYRLTTHAPTSRRRRLPRLPSAYPAV